MTYIDKNKQRSLDDLEQINSVLVANGYPVLKQKYGEIVTPWVLDRCIKDALGKPDKCPKFVLDYESPGFNRITRRLQRFIDQLKQPKLKRKDGR